MEGFLKRHAPAVDDDFRQDLKLSMTAGYGKGIQREDQQGSDPQTED
ncbi:hypothetical protein [Streptomyces sp. NPDC001933]